jgi:hypothetical protein
MFNAAAACPRSAPSLPGVCSSGDTPGVVLCDSCAQLNPYASALRKAHMERSSQFKATAGGVGGLQFGVGEDSILCVRQAMHTCA